MKVVFCNDSWRHDDVTLEVDEVKFLPRVGEHVQIGTMLYPCMVRRVTHDFTEGEIYIHVEAN